MSNHSKISKIKSEIPQSNRVSRISKLKSDVSMSNHSRISRHNSEIPQSNHDSKISKLKSDMSMSNHSGIVRHESDELTNNNKSFTTSETSNDIDNLFKIDSKKKKIRKKTNNTKHDIKIYVNNLNSINYGDEETYKLIRLIKNLKLNSNINIFNIKNTKYDGKDFIIVVDSIEVDDFNNIYENNNSEIKHLFNTDKPALPAKHYKNKESMYNNNIYVSNGTEWLLQKLNVNSEDRNYIVDEKEDKNDMVDEKEDTNSEDKNDTVDEKEAINSEDKNDTVDEKEAINSEDKNDTVDEKEATNSEDKNDEDNENISNIINNYTYNGHTNFDDLAEND